MQGIGAIVNQANLNYNSSAVKSDNAVNNTNVCFLETVAAVAKGAGIIIAGGNEIKQLDFLKRKFDLRDRLPEREKGIYDFLAEIEQILREKRSG